MHDGGRQNARRRRHTRGREPHHRIERRPDRRKHAVGWRPCRQRNLAVPRLGRANHRWNARRSAQDTAADPRRGRCRRHARRRGSSDPPRRTAGAWPELGGRARSSRRAATDEVRLEQRSIGDREREDNQEEWCPRSHHGSLFAGDFSFPVPWPVCTQSGCCAREFFRKILFQTLVQA